MCNLMQLVVVVSTKWCDAWFRDVSSCIIIIQIVNLMTFVAIQVS